MDSIKNKLSVYNQKIASYTNLLSTTKSESTKNKAQQKINKYIAKKQCILNKCVITYDTKRIPSNCDRILFKGTNIIPTSYSVYSDNSLIKLSDHLMVIGSFNFKEEVGIVLTWNIAKSHSEDDIICGIDKLFSDNIKMSEDYIIFCLQESPILDKFPNILINKFINTSYKIICNSSNSLSGQSVRLFVFNKKFGTDVNNFNSCSNTLVGISSLINYFNTSESPVFIDVKKHVLGTKSYVSITINDLTFISCHLPIDTKIKTEENYLGNNLRVNALRKIQDDMLSNQNIIIAGDLNFRISNSNTNSDQLNLLLELDKSINLKEFGVLTTKTCKVKCKI